MKIEVTRPFYLNGEPLAIGTKAEVDERLGRELIYNGKAKKVDEAAAAATPEVPKRAAKRKESEE